MKIFDVENNKVVLTPTCLLIPEFKVLIKKFEKNPISIISYIEFMTNPSSPYAAVPESDKSEVIAKDMGIDFSLDDLDVEAALKKAEELYMSPTRRFYFDSKVGLEKMGAYLRSSGISSGRDGNDSTYLSMLKSVGKITLEFQQLEKIFKEEVATLRGGQQSSYDEDQ